jgi:transcriptional regulator with XRE-family HTH domain
VKKPKERQNEPGPRAAVIEALLAGETQAGAAIAAGVSRRTVSRWLRDPAFAAELEKARTLAFAEALSALKGGAAAAVKTLLQNLGARSPAERRQAAREILTFAFKGVETLDFEARLERIEKLLEEQRPRARVS